MSELKRCLEVSRSDSGVVIRNSLGGPVVFMTLADWERVAELAREVEGTADLREFEAIKKSSGIDLKPKSGGPLFSMLVSGILENQPSEDARFEK